MPSAVITECPRTPPLQETAQSDRRPVWYGGCQQPPEPAPSLFPIFFHSCGIKIYPGPDLRLPPLHPWILTGRSDAPPEHPRTPGPMQILHCKYVESTNSVGQCSCDAQHAVQGLSALRLIGLLIGLKMDQTRPDLARPSFAEAAVTCAVWCMQMLGPRPSPEPSQDRGRAACKKSLYLFMMCPVRQSCRPLF